MRERELHRFCSCFVLDFFCCVSSDCVDLFSALMDVHYRYIRQRRDDVFELCLVVMEVKVMVKLVLDASVLAYVIYDPV